MSKKYFNLLIINCIVIVGMKHLISYPRQSFQVITICFTATFIYLTKANKSLFTDLKLQDTNNSLNKYFDIHNKLYKTTNNVHGAQTHYRLILFKITIIRIKNLENKIKFS